MALNSASSIRVAVLLVGLLSIPALAGAAGWVLVAPPRDEKGNYLRNVPVNGSWTQLAAFDTAAQCEEQRRVEIDIYKPDFRLWRQEFLIRCMPYDLWWKAQQK